MQADNLTNDEKLANTLALIDSAFARIRKEMANVSPEERAKLRAACDSDRCTDNRIYTGQAGGRYFA